MQLAAQLAADFVVLLHASYVAFVIFGQLFILVGGWRGWSWVHGVWFRGGHLVAIGIVVLESWIGIVCPLTTLEQWLRRRAGQASYQGDFLGRIVHELLFVDWAPWVFTTVYTMFGAAVLGSLWLVPIRRQAPDDSPTA